MNKKSLWIRILGFFVNLKEIYPFIQADEQIRLSWLTRVRTIDEVPETYRETFEDLVGSSEFPYTLLTPSYQGFSFKGSEKLVFCLKDRVYELSAAAGAVFCKFHPLKHVLYIEVGRALLHSWVTICSTADNGEPIITDYIFNTISEHIFTPIVTDIRLVDHDPREIPLDIQPANFDFLLRENMKLMNYARRSLLPDETPVMIVLQPEIRKEIIRVFGKSLFKVVSLSHLTILTDRELILIQEGTGERGGEDIRYGGVFRYIPIGNIDSLKTTVPKDDVFTMSVQFSCGVCLDSKFADLKRKEVEIFRNRVKTVVQTP